MLGPRVKPRGTRVAGIRPIAAVTPPVAVPVAEPVPTPEPRDVVEVVSRIGGRTKTIRT